MFVRNAQLITTESVNEGKARVDDDDGEDLVWIGVVEYGVVGASARQEGKKRRGKAKLPSLSSRAQALHDCVGVLTEYCYSYYY